MKNARLLSRALEKTEYFEVLSDIHRPVGGLLADAKLAFDEGSIDSYTHGLPVVAFRFSEQFRQQNPNVQQKWIQTLLRAKGWIVPNYELAPNLEHIEILRVVVRETMTAVMVERLLEDIVEIVEEIQKEKSPAHNLAMLRRTSTLEAQHGSLELGSGSQSSGTYAKQC